MSGHVALEDLDWHEDAIATIAGIAQAQEFMTADDLSREMRKPPHANMPGQAFAAAKSLKLIRAVGYQTSSSKSRKNGVLRIWTRCRPNEGENVNYRDDDQLTDEELDAKADELADQFEERAHQARKGE